jgi:hypothetical protein
MDDMIRQILLFFARKEAAGPKHWLTLQSEGEFSASAEEYLDTSGDAVAAQL